jgi:hypothetical protein
MGRRTQAPISHPYIAWLSARMHRLHLDEIVGEERRDDPRQEHTGAHMAQPQQSCHGNAAPRPLLRRLAEGLLEGRRIRHRAPRAIDEKRAMAPPPPVVHGGPLHRAPETLEEEGEEGPRESGTRLTIGRRTAPQARQVGQMAAGGVTVQHLQEEELHGDDWREHAVTPCGIPDLATPREDGVGLQPRGPLTRDAWQDGGDAWDSPASPHAMSWRALHCANALMRRL